MPILQGSATTTGGNIYTSSGNTVITWVSLCNYTAANITANLHVLQTGCTAANINMIACNVLITSGDTYQIYTGNEKLILSNTQALYAVANANALAATVSYTSA
jgi:hypothetical protein